MWRLLELIYNLFEPANRGMTVWDFMIVRIAMFLMVVVNVTGIGIKYADEGFPGHSAQWKRLESMIEYYHPSPKNPH